MRVPDAVAVALPVEVALAVLTVGVAGEGVSWKVGTAVKVSVAVRLRLRVPGPVRVHEPLPVGARDAVEPLALGLLEAVSVGEAEGKGVPDAGLRLREWDRERDAAVGLQESVEALWLRALGTGVCEREGEGVTVGVADGRLIVGLADTEGDDGLCDGVTEWVVVSRWVRVAVALGVVVRVGVRVVDGLLKGIEVEDGKSVRRRFRKRGRTLPTSSNEALGCLVPTALEKLKLWGRGPLEPLFHPAPPKGGSKGRPLSHDE